MVDTTCQLEKANMSEEFKIGDNVQVKGISGPVMTVEDTDRLWVWVTWYRDEWKREKFHPDTLEKVE